MRKLIYIPTKVDELYSNIQDVKRKITDISPDGSNNI